MMTSGWLTASMPSRRLVCTQKRGSFDDGLVFAVRLRLIEIGEAVKRIGPDILASESEIPWEDVAEMRDRLAHRCFATSHAIVRATVDVDLAIPEAAVRRLRAQPARALRTPVVGLPSSFLVAEKMVPYRRSSGRFDAMLRLRTSRAPASDGSLKGCAEA